MRVEAVKSDPSLAGARTPTSVKLIAAKAGGTMLMVTAAIVWAALLTWSAMDPGLSRDSIDPPSNLFGSPGAFIADVMLQLFGIAALFLVLPIALWGFRLLRDGYLRGWSLRVLLALPVLLLLPGGASMIGVPSAWPIPHGLGGLLGDAVYNVLQPFFNFSGRGAYSSFVGLVLVAACVAGLLRLCGVRSEHWSLMLPEATAGDTEPSTHSLSHTARLISYASRFSLFRGTGGRLAPLGGEALAGGFHRDVPQAHGGDIEDERQEPVFSSALDVVPYRTSDDHDDELRRNGQVDHAEGDLADQNDTETSDERALAARFAPRGRGASAAAAPAAPSREAQASMPAFLRQAQVGQAFDAPARGAPRQRSRGRGGYQPPSLNLLQRGASSRGGSRLTQSTLRGNARLLEDTLAEFGVKGEIVNVHPGPVVTLYELEPAKGVKTSRVVGLSDDIARSMGALSARIAVIPGRNAIGIELPNDARDTVVLRDLLGSDAFRRSEGRLALAMGKAINGEPIIADLASMPHLLVAGTTGSGKSVGINAMILSLLFRLSPEQCRLIMIDPKMLELSVYNGIPHLLTPVVTDPNKAVAALNWVVREMEDRYNRMSKLGVRNIGVFNNRVRHAQKMGEQLTRNVQSGHDPETGEAVYSQENMASETMAHIVVVVDEMADLMMVAGKDIEASVQRLAQMARAAGIHLIMATQRPSVDVITGTIKANFPSRCSFKVASKVDSRTILNEQGAEQLLGAGDMLFSQGGATTTRVHGAFVSDDEVEAIADYLRSLGTPDYVDGVTKVSDPDEGSAAGQGKGGAEDIYDQAIAVMVRDQKVSTSYLQRKLGIGYNRAADLIDRMEEEGLIGPAGSGGKREILR